MDSNQISAPQPDTKLLKPRGQVNFIDKLAAMLQNRGWDSDFGDPANDINRASSAPPMHDMSFDDQQFSMDPRLSRPAYSPGPNNWNLWAPPAGTNSTNLDAANSEMVSFLLIPINRSVLIL